MAFFISSRNRFAKKLIKIGVTILTLWLILRIKSMRIIEESFYKQIQQSQINFEINLPQLKHRNELAVLMESMGGKKMVEVCVKRR